MKIYVARHAETNYNELGLANDDPNVNVFLTKKGKEQAKKLAKELKDKQIDLIIVSGLNRTRETAEIVNQYHKAPIIVDKNLNDNRSGYEGRLISDYNKERDSSEFPLEVRLNGGESILDVYARTKVFLDSLINRSEENILVVTSSIIVQQINNIIDGLPVEIPGTPVPNASCLEFDLNKYFSKETK